MNEARMLPDLPTVTLVAVTSVALGPTIAALQASMAQCKFAEVLLLSDRQPAPGIDRTIQWRQIRPLVSRADYSQFMLRELAAHLATTHALCIQWDGFVLRGEAWEPALFDHDYIGAVWPQFIDGHNVGNGGFSLRSRRLLEACRDLPFDASEPEDLIICRRWRSHLEGEGFRFAPESIARRFSYERTQPRGDEFGFHGAFNLVRHVSPADALRLFRSLEPRMLARSERRELAAWALRHGRARLAFEMLRRLA